MPSALATGHPVSLHLATFTPTAPCGAVSASAEQFRLKATRTRPGAVSGRNWARWQHSAKRGSTATPAVPEDRAAGCLAGLQHPEFPRLAAPDAPAGHGREKVHQTANSRTSSSWTASPAQVEDLPPRTPTASPAPQRGFLPNGHRPTAPPYDINYGAASSVTIAAKPSPAMPTVPN